ncbi:MAG: hypothetical protein NC331_16645 [Lachnospiraceae bacterium]|nr:hypothetical protein [Lachnospiraceae bacterium]MCM1240980.1 hypothetical protein [Lachnospiraceae bacterium]
MGEIVLKRANVVKKVDSEDRAAELESKGFVRTDGKASRSVDPEVAQLKEALARAGKAIDAADARKGELEMELSAVREQLTEAEGRIGYLETELAGTKEQLEAAVKKNKDAAPSAKKEK